MHRTAGPVCHIRVILRMLCALIVAVLEVFSDYRKRPFPEDNVRLALCDRPIGRVDRNPVSGRLMLAHMCDLRPDNRGRLKLGAQGPDDGPKMESGPTQTSG